MQPVDGFDLTAGVGDLGLDANDVVVDVHAVGHCLRVAVFLDQVLVEEAEGLLVGRGGQANQVRIELLQHLAPEVVDGAVRLVGDDNVKGLDRERGVAVDGRDLKGKGALTPALSH
ncbi:MAG: hypothetical protein ACK5YV_00390 [Betaproteobacteria bacterium]